MKPSYSYQWFECPDCGNEIEVRIEYEIDTDTLTNNPDKWDSRVVFLGPEDFECGKCGNTIVIKDHEIGYVEDKIESELRGD